MAAQERISRATAKPKLGKRRVTCTPPPSPFPLPLSPPFSPNRVVVNVVNVVNGGSERGGRRLKTHTHAHAPVVPMVCSFAHDLSHDCLRAEALATATPIAHVLLGMSQTQEDVKAALLDGTIHFLPLTAGCELPHLIAGVVHDVAGGGGDSFAVRADEIRDTISYFLMCVFGCDSTNRIGACYSSNFQRLLYNVAACTVARFCPLHASGCPEWLGSRTAALRRAARLVAQFADALKGWLPVADWLDGWTPWHALAYTLEMTDQTIVEANNPEVRGNFAFLVFCDEIFRNVIEEARRPQRPQRPQRTQRPPSSGIGSVADLKTAFGWCACSAHFNYVLECCVDRSVKAFLPNARLFATMIDHAFNAPVVADACATRHASPNSRRPSGGREISPQSDVGSRHAKRSVDGEGTPKRLCLR